MLAPRSEIHFTTDGYKPLAALCQIVIRPGINFDLIRSDGPARSIGTLWMPAVRVSWRSVTCHDEFTQRLQESAKRAEKTSKEAAAHALPAARAAREQTATRSTDASNAGSSGVCICGSRDRLTPASGRRCREGIMQPFSAVSVSLLSPREIVFSARCGARQL